MTSSVSSLKSGLASFHPMVRFASAEALIYLGSTAGAEELGKLAQNHRQLRYWSLLALASLNEAVCRNRLADFAPTFRPRTALWRVSCALRWMGRTDPEGADGFIVGQRLGTFWLHRVAPNSAPLIHVSMKSGPRSFSSARVSNCGRRLAFRPVRSLRSRRRGPIAVW